MMMEQELRDRLGTVDVPPTRLQVRALVDAGRRRAFRRRTIQGVCGVALATGLLATVPSLVFGAGGQPPAQSAASAGAQKRDLRCGVTKLAVPAGMTAVLANAVDPTGKYVVGNQLVAAPSANQVKGVITSASQPVLWTNGQPRALPLMGRTVSGSAVNASGVVVALAGDKQWDSVIRYVDGVPAKLSPPAGDWVFQNPKINSGGDILVTASAKSQPNGKSAVLLWKAGSGTATRLPLPPEAEGVDITDNGTIVGNVTTPSDIADVGAYAWDQQGNGRKLATPTGQTGVVNSAQGDWATGNLWPSGTAARWNLRTGEVTDLNIHGPAHAVNAQGWIVADGTLQRDGATVKLEASDGVTGEPADVSDTGIVVGSILTEDKNNGDAATSGGPLTWRCDR